MKKNKITVVTPVLNQAQFIEQTIDSVLSQGIEDLEYIILDAGSTDGTVDIIKKHERHLARWRSHKDAGQSSAIHEGFSSASGDLLCWINSDDYFEPGALKRMIGMFDNDEQLDLCYGDYSILLPDGTKEAKLKISFDFEIALLFYLMIPQPSSVWTKRLYDSVGGLDTALNYSFDYDFFLRAGQRLQARPDAIRHVHDLVSVFRIHPESKSVSAQAKFVSENESIMRKFDNFPTWKRSSFYRRYQMVRTLLRYHSERGMVPTRKDTRKA
ncbi:glycosyltransferase [Luteolibacter yonseiensis]|uniref:Glycosyltransferase n=1 Tax=Luteolibacter yonseiensis TaxID=1144680 RepID=A0A934V5X2_9BACT|nr:glycosyltransferase family 2 protein [Luteolibacter yonseiensis]MBK1814402.1 glycosyltransferase [Luteolibacter yonseiensis]